MEQAIRLAVEGGWRESLEIDKIEILIAPAKGNDDFNFSLEEARLWHADQYWVVPFDSILLDPLFWQALFGKCSRGVDPETKEPYMADPSEVYDQEIWKDNWHCFVEHLIEGGTPDDFFANLLKK